MRWRIRPPAFTETEMTVLNANLGTCSFQTGLGGQDIPKADRRFILIPIAGCPNNVTADQNLHLGQLCVSDFNDNNGWPQGTHTIIEFLDVGESVCQNDGVGQEQVIVRVI
jgi:hypothetical protein